MVLKRSCGSDDFDSGWGGDLQEVFPGFAPSLDFNVGSVDMEVVSVESSGNDLRVNFDELGSCDSGVNCSDVS